MKTQDILIVQPQTAEQVSALKAILQAFKIKYRISKEEKYDIEFVEKIMQGEKELAEGKGKKMTTEDFKSLCK